MGDLLESLVRGSQKRTILCHWGESLQMVSESLPSLKWWERAQAQWRTPARTLGPKRGWLWRPTSPGNEDVLICINALFMTQRVLKPWWLWTYQNSAVKRTSARVVSGWVTSWKVWFGEPKTDNIVSLGMGRYIYYNIITNSYNGPKNVMWYNTDERLNNKFDT
jgi:hypothetical protein